MKKKWWIAPAVLLVAAAAGAWGWTTVSRASEDFGLAELRVANLSCGSCVSNIRQALEPVAGVGAVEVNLTTGRARVEYAPGRIAPGEIAERIGRAGYPAEIDQLLSPADYLGLQAERSRLSEKFVARIGERLITREEFSRRVAALEGDPRVAARGLLRSAWEELLQRELLLGAAAAEGILVQDGEVDRELARRGMDGEHPGTGEALRRGLRENMIIDRLIEEHVLAGERHPSQRRAKLERWYRQLQAETPVVILDPALEAAAGSPGAGSGCGGSCC